MSGIVKLQSECSSLLNQEGVEGVSRSVHFPRSRPLFVASRQIEGESDGIHMLYIVDPHARLREEESGLGA